jgi:hypothetical protein
LDLDYQIRRINVLPLQSEQLAASQSGSDVQQHPHAEWVFKLGQAALYFRSFMHDRKRSPLRTVSASVIGLPPCSSHSANCVVEENTHNVAKFGLRGIGEFIAIATT